MAKLTLDGISKRYPGAERNMVAVDNLSLEVDDGELMVLVGPSGCGKSTALRMIAGLEQISEGELRIDGVRMNERDSSERDIAMVFQNYALYPHMSVYRNIAYPLIIQKKSREEIDQRVQATASTLQLTELLGRRPSQLSGGQRQRVAMGRALIRRPKAFLMDEPLSNLDAKLRVKMRAEITAIQRQVGVTTVYVTHDQVEAVTMGDRIAVMRGGVLQQVATPADMFWRPANAFVAGFIGSPPMNLFTAGLTRNGSGVDLSLGDQTLSLTGSEAALHAGLATHGAGKLIVGIRPEHLSLADESEPGHLLRGRVNLVEHLGSELVLYVDIGANHFEAGAREDNADGNLGGTEHALVARARSKLPVAIGETVLLKVEAEDLRFFDAGTTLALA